MKQILRFFLFFQLCFATNLASAQWVLINDGGGSPVGSAALEIRSTTRGMLMPRMTEAERLAITSPANGLLVYQTDLVSGFYLYQNGSWVILDGKTVVNNANEAQIAIVRDIKPSNTDGGFHFR